MDKSDLVLIGVFFAIVLGLAVGCGGAGYYIGKSFERAALHDALVVEIEMAYQEGKKDGEKIGLKTCDDVIDGLNVRR